MKFSFYVPRNLSNHMDRQARTSDTVLVKSRKMTGRSQTLPWWLGRGGIKTTENKIKLAPLMQVFCKLMYFIIILVHSILSLGGGGGWGWRWPSSNLFLVHVKRHFVNSLCFPSPLFLDYDSCSRVPKRGTEKVVFVFSHFVLCLFTYCRLVLCRCVHWEKSHTCT